MTTDNTAHPAPTPAPVAVPERAVVAGLAARREYRENRRRANAVEIGVDEVHRILTAAAPHMSAPRPEPVVASREVFDRCPTIGCGGDARYAAPGRGHIPTCDYPASIPEPVVAPLPSEAVRETLVRDVLKALRTAWQDDYSTRTVAEGVADAVLAAGYRLVPEDDEDTVRVPREEWPLSDGERRTSLHEPLRGTPPVLCRECGEEVEAYCLVAISGLSAGYRWRHVADGTYQCIPEPRRVRPYDDFDAARRVDGTR